MRRSVLAAMMGAWVAAAAMAQAEKPSLQSLTDQAVELDKLVRKAADANERKRLLEGLEKIKHQMGPFDAAGTRVRCQAMWHDAALESLEPEIKRLSVRAPGSPAALAPLASDARLFTRRMASACLARGWQMPDGKTKYQVDAFGEYLCNNAKSLDGLFDALNSWAVKEAKLAPENDDRATFKMALEKARQGVARMGGAADAAAKADAESQDELAAALGEFVQGLGAVRECDLAMTEHFRKKGKTSAASTEPAEALPPEPPPLTAGEKANLSRLKETAVRLQGEEWAPIGRFLERFAAAVDAGFQVPGARPRARELLDQIARAADLVESLRTSKAAYPDYLKARQEELLGAFGQIADPQERAKGYAKLAETWQDDRMRRQIEIGNLTPVAAQGLTRAYYAIWPELYNSEDRGAREQGRKIRDGCRTLANIFEMMPAWPPADMALKLRECYASQQQLFRQSAGRAGEAFSGKSEINIDELAAAADRAADLELIVRADLVIKAVTRHRPARASAMSSQVAGAALDLVSASVSPQEPRQTLENLVRPFEDLDKFPVPEPEYQKVVSRLAGSAYAGAAAMLSRELTAAIDTASTGDPLPLKHALEARHLFGLLRNRAIAETVRFDKAGVANLVTFSIPEKPWSQFVANLDQRMKAMFAEYAKNGRGRQPWLQAASDWTEVYRAAAAGQRQTLDARSEGESDLDLLLRNLEGVAVPSPGYPTWQVWAAGYHATEAAMAVNAGFDSVAEWHRDQLRAHDAQLRAVELAPVKTTGARPKAGAAATP